MQNVKRRAGAAGTFQDSLRPGFPIFTAGLNTTSRYIPLERLEEWRAGYRRTGRTLVVTNGCFDLLHTGHIAYLEAARGLGDGLLVGVNSDASVRLLKGADRPLNPELDRARVVGALACVDAVTVFGDKRATRFLELAQPDVWVKGGDYTLASIDQDERRAVEHCAGRIVFLPFVAGRSTTELVGKIRRL